MGSAIAILICLLFSAFFSGMEIAFISANRFKVEVARKQGSSSAEIIAGFFDHPSRFISTLLVGNNISLVIYGILMAGVLEPLLSTMVPNPIGLMALQTVFATLIILVTAEFLPKAFFRISPNRMLQVFAYPAKACSLALHPIVWAIDRLSHRVLRVFFKMRVVEEAISFGRVDLDRFVHEFSPSTNQNEDEGNEIRIFKNALGFGETKVRECMVPRTDIVAVDIESDVEGLRQRFLETGFSKILIFREDIYNIIGYVHSFELFQRPTNIRSIIRPISLVPESTRARDLLKQFGQQHRSVAVVLNEFGTTAGMVTVEDIIEEIFGDFDDEHDTEGLLAQRLEDGKFLLSGRLEVSFINSEFGLELPESEEYSTLGGYIIHHHQSIPQVGDRLEVGRFIITIEKMDRTRIEEVRLTLGEET